jgi:hypothetical protein
MPQQVNGGVRTAVNADLYGQAVNGYLVQTEKQGGGNVGIV